MRFKIHIVPQKRQGNILLPINYQYALSSFIYNTLNKGDKEIAKWLHENGYVKDQKKFKLFTFSHLDIPEYKRYEDRLILMGEDISFTLSILPIKMIEPLINGLFKNKGFSLGDKKSQADFTIKGIEKIQEPDFTNEMKFRTLSPIVVSTKNSMEDKYAQYLAPKDPGYAEKLKQNLLNKLVAFNQSSDKVPEIEKSIDFSVSILNKPKSKLAHIKAMTKNIKIRGYMYNFQVKGPVELIKMGFFAGFGEKNSMGFGCCEMP